MSADSIKRIFRICLDRIDVISRNAEAVQLELEWLGQQAMLLDLWASLLGVFAEGPYSIAHRFRKNVAVSQATMQLLLALQSDLRSCDGTLNMA